MKSRSRLVVMVWMTLAASVCLSAPSSAQKSDGAALAARIAELSRAGKYTEAIPLAQRQLESMEKTYGPDHREVAAALNNLALLYGDQGRAAEAEPLYKRSLAIFEKANGLDSPEIASGLNNLAALYQRQERYADAEPLFKRALAIRERSLPRNHPDLGQSLNNLRPFTKNRTAILRRSARARPAETADCALQQEPVGAFYGPRPIVARIGRTTRRAAAAFARLSRTALE